MEKDRDVSTYMPTNGHHPRRELICCFSSKTMPTARSSCNISLTGLCLHSLLGDACFCGPGSSEGQGTGGPELVRDDCVVVGKNVQETLI